MGNRAAGWRNMLNNWAAAARRTALGTAWPQHGSWQALETLEQRVLLSASSAIQVLWQGKMVNAMPDQYIASVDAGQDFAAIAAAGGLKLDGVSQLDDTDYYFKETQLTPDQLAAWAVGRAGLENVSPNQVRQMANLPNESTVDTAPAFSDFWWLQNTGQALPNAVNGPATGTAGADIGAINAWNVTQGSHNVVIAVLDSGLSASALPAVGVGTATTASGDFQSNVWINTKENTNLNALGLPIDNDLDGVPGDVRGANFSTTDAVTGVIIPDGVITDVAHAPAEPYDGHGTFVAGIIGAMGNNAYNLGLTTYNAMVGVNWNVTILPVKIVDKGQPTDAAILMGLNYIHKLKTQFGVNIVAANMSLTSLKTGTGNDTNLTSLTDAIKRVTDDGILITVPAGNDGVNVDTTPIFPDNINNSRVIKVAATDAADNLANTSNYGPNTVNLAAPGVDITSTSLDGGLRVDSGTSFAAPMVAGAIGLLYAINPNATPDQVRDAIYKSVDRVTSLQDKVALAGRLNVNNAVQLMLGKKAPTGGIDTFTGKVIQGWAFDGNAGAAPIVVRVDIDGVQGTAVAGTFAAAGDARSDVKAAVGSADHGFTFMLPTLSPGVHTISVFEEDVGGGNWVLMSSKSIDTTLPPQGFVDTVNATTVAGWAFDQNAGATPINVRVDIDGATGTPFVAGDQRDDLIPVVASNMHGFTFTMPTLSSGFHRVDVFAYDVPTNVAKRLGSFTINNDQGVTGWVDFASNYEISAWLMDPDAPTTAVNAHLEIDGVPTGTITAGIQRLDLIGMTVGSVGPIVSGQELHGLDFIMPGLSAGMHTVKLFATDLETNSSTLIAERQVVGNQAPVGFIDTLSPQVGGWVYDPDNPTASLKVRVDVDDSQGPIIDASAARPDVATAIGSADHGYAFTLPTLSQGVHTVRVFALDSASLAPTLVATQMLVVAPPVASNATPFGHVDVLNSTLVSGWAYDSDAGAGSISVRVDVDGLAVGAPTANEDRPDLAAFPVINGTQHGFTFALSGLTAGPHQVEVWALDDADSGAFLIGSGTVNANPQQGQIETLSTSHIVGWALDPATGNNPQFRLDVDGAAGTVQTATIDRTALGKSATLIGFDVPTPPMTAGVQHVVTLNVIEAGTDRVIPVASGNIIGNRAPIGRVDILNNTAITGWAADQDTLASPVTIVISVDGVDGASLTANQTRLDLQSFLSSTDHGFVYNFNKTVSAGRHLIAVKALDTGSGMSTTLQQQWMYFV